MNVKIRRIALDSAPFVSGAIAILLAVAIVLHPEPSFQASLQGLKLWWNLVFPALLPFLILSEMLTASGFAHGFGVLLEPLMRRAFRLPGAGGWALWLGLSVGYPGGAQGVQQLHKQGSLSDKEAGQLAALVHFGSPATLLIVVGVALLHNPAAGYGLLAIHWLSGLLAGYIAVRFRRLPKNAIEPLSKLNIHPTQPLYRRVRNAAAEARSQDGRSFGKLLGDSVGSSVQSLMFVGGYMIIFAVIISIIKGVFPQLPNSLTAGLLEIHLGAQTLSEVIISGPKSSSGQFSLALISAALGWSGLCAQLQVLTILKPAKVRFLPFAALRILHGIFAFLLTLWFWRPLMSFYEATLPVFASSDTIQTTPISFLLIGSTFPKLVSLQASLLLLLLLLSAVFAIITAIQRRFD